MKPLAAGCLGMYGIPKATPFRPVTHPLSCRYTHRSNGFQHQLLKGRKVLVNNRVENVTNLTSLVTNLGMGRGAASSFQKRLGKSVRESLAVIKPRRPTGPQRPRRDALGIFQPLPPLQLLRAEAFQGQTSVVNLEARRRGLRQWQFLLETTQLKDTD